MSKRFKLFWLITTTILFLIVLSGLSLLSQMALMPNGNVPKIPWAEVFGAAVAVAVYWSALCWTLGLLRRKPLVALAIVGAAALVAFGYPLWDQARYQKQQEAARQSGLIGIPPDWAGKTALLIWPRSDECAYECWVLSVHMQARMLVLAGEAARDVDFSEPVNLAALPLAELSENVSGSEIQILLPVTDRPAIDYVIVHHERGADFDGVFAPIRPAGIAPEGHHIDAAIVPVIDMEQFDIGQASPVLRLSHVSRTVAEIPFAPFNGRRMYWNHSDRLANFEIAKPYFCTSDLPEQWRCSSAFD